jgi:hypothetical protein
MSTVEGTRIHGRTPARTAAAVAVGLLAAAVVVLPPLFVYSVMATYGPGDEPFTWQVRSVVLVVAYAVVSGVVVAWAARFGARMLDRRPPRAWVVAPVVAVLALGAPFAAGWAGQQAWEQDQGVITAACTTDEVAAVALMAPYGTEFSPAEGQTDGTCAGWIMLAGDEPEAAMAALWADMEADGWTTPDTGPWERTWSHDGSTVRVWHIQSSEGSTGAGVEGLS